MPNGWPLTLRRVRSDLREGRHREAYAVFAIGLVLTVLGLVGGIPERYLLSGLLLAVTFLVFRSTIEPAGPFTSVNDVLNNRESFVPFPELVKGAGQLWVYGPTATNVVSHVADIKQHVLARGGSVRVIVQDPASPSVDDVGSQLDDNTDFRSDLSRSLATLAKLEGTDGFEYRLLGFSPGFSMVVVDAATARGFLILELQGFKDDNIAGRMHVRIARAESLHWFDYWVARFEAMWDSAAKPGT
jgi:hypothetical protein